MPITKFIVYYILDAVDMRFKELVLHSLAENVLSATSPPAFPQIFLSLTAC